MSVLFVGGEMSAFSPSDASVTETDYALFYDATYGRCSLQTSSVAGNTTSYLETDTLGTQTGTVWLHYTEWTARPPGLGVADMTAIMWRSSAGVDVLKMVCIGNNSHEAAMDVGFYYKVGGVWTLIGSRFILSVAVLDQIDIKVKLGASGEVAFFSSGNARFSALLDLSSIADIEKIQLYCTYNPPRYSEVIVADESTIGWRVFCDEPTGNGSNTAWTGDYTNVDELVFSDADRIYTDTATNVETFTKARTLTGYDIIAVAVAARAKKGSTGPQHIKLAVRVGGTNYFSGSRSMSEGYAPYVYVWNTNPATGVAWLAAAAAAEFGVQAIA